MPESFSGGEIASAMSAASAVADPVASPAADPTTTAAGACTGVGIGPKAIDSVIGVVKAYTTRVGNGPFPTELNEQTGETLRRIGNEFGATTGRPRRCGWFDAVVARYAARVNGLTDLAVTKLDVLDDFEEIKMAVAYEIGGERVDNFPDDMAEVSQARPVYESFKGWKSSTIDARSWQDLPNEAKTYLKKVEEVTRVKVSYVSVGTDREQIININH